MGFSGVAGISGFSGFSSSSGFSGASGPGPSFHLHPKGTQPKFGVGHYLVAPGMIGEREYVFVKKYYFNPCGGGHPVGCYMYDTTGGTLREGDVSQSPAHAPKPPGRWPEDYALFSVEPVESTPDAMREAELWSDRRDKLKKCFEMASAEQRRASDEYFRHNFECRHLEWELRSKGGIGGLDYSYCKKCGTHVSIAHGAPLPPLDSPLEPKSYDVTWA